MASDADQDFADKMQMLRDKYVVRLVDTRVALETAMARLSEGSATGDERADIEAQAHKLAGTGTSYGFPVISEIAAALEDAVRDGRAAEEVAVLTGNLVAAITDIS